MAASRSIGYCLKLECEDHHKGVFLLNSGDEFYCPRCSNQGAIIPERGFSTVVESQPFKEVRINYNYSPAEDRYLETAIVKDESIREEGSVYTLISPMIKTERRALKVAEAILSNLQRYSDLVPFDDNDIPRTTEVIVSFDVERSEFTNKMVSLGKQLEKSSLVCR